MLARSHYHCRIPQKAGEKLSALLHMAFDLTFLITWGKSNRADWPIVLDIIPSFLLGLINRTMSWKCSLCCFAALRLILLLTHKFKAFCWWRLFCRVWSQQLPKNVPTSQHIHSSCLWEASSLSSVATRWTSRSKVNIKSLNLKCTYVYFSWEF